MISKVLQTMSVAAAVVLFAASPRGGVSTGAFALQGVEQKTNGYLTATEIHGGPLNRRFDLWLTASGSKEALRNYDIDMTKLLHLVIVSDDFRTFLHVHPQLHPDGHFVIEQRLPHPALYHVYADAEPTGIGQQVFRFDVDLGGANARRRVTGKRSSTVAVGPYTVRLSSSALRAGTESRLIVRIMKNGKPADDLHPYLGALAHAVFLNARDLSYVHVHPMPVDANAGAMMMGGMQMDDMPMKSLPDSSITSPTMALHVALAEPGTYELWRSFAAATSSS